MRKLILGLALLMCLLDFSYGQKSMCRVMSYNIWYANPDAGENIWDNRRDGVAQAILDQKMDIAGLQEVLIHQLNDLESRLEEYSYVGVARDDGKQQGEFAPLFFHKKRFKLLDSGNFWLSEYPDSAGSRGWDAACVRIVTWAKLKDLKSRKTFFAFNTHFDHEGDTARLRAPDYSDKKFLTLLMIIQLY